MPLELGNIETTKYVKLETEICPRSFWNIHIMNRGTSVTEILHVLNLLSFEKALNLIMFLQ